MKKVSFFQLIWPWHCERRCESLPTDLSRNVLLLAGDRMIAATCDSALNTGPVANGKVIWADPNNNRPDVLMASCTDIEVQVI